MNVIVTFRYKLKEKLGRIIQRLVCIFSSSKIAFLHDKSERYKINVLKYLSLGLGIVSMLSYTYILLLLIDSK